MKGKSRNKVLCLINEDFHRYRKMLKCFFIVFVIGHLFIVFSDIISEITPSPIVTYRCGTVEVPPLSFMDILLNIQDPLNIWMGTGMAAIVGYSFLIWYREWYSNNKTIYTLLSIPMNRHIIILCKLCNVIAVYLMYLLTQFACIFVDYFFMKFAISSSRLMDVSIRKSLARACPLLPYNLWTLGLYLLIAILIILMVFSFIMTERCYKSKGIFLFIIIIISTVVMFTEGPYMFHGVIKGKTALKYTVMTYFGALFLCTIVSNYFNAYHLLTKKVDV